MDDFSTENGLEKEIKTVSEVWIGASVESPRSTTWPWFVAEPRWPAWGKQAPSEIPHI